MNTPVLVPRRPDGGRRDEIWRYLSTKYWPQFSDLTIFESDAPGEPFARAAAINAAAAAAGDWEVAIIADADSFVPVAQLRAAQARVDYRMVIPHTRWLGLSDYDTTMLLRGWIDKPYRYAVERTGSSAVSGVLVVPRAVWDAVGGFDEAFVGYGWEDFAFARACELYSGLVRVDGPVWHMSHPPMDQTSGNALRYEHYLNARTFEDLDLP